MYRVVAVTATVGVPVIRNILAGREVVGILFTPLSLLVDTRRKLSCTRGVKTNSSPPTPAEATASASPPPVLIADTNAVTIVAAVSAPTEV